MLRQIVHPTNIARYIPFYFFLAAIVFPRRPLFMSSAFGFAGIWQTYVVLVC